MCGIFGYVSTKENSAKIVLNSLKKLEYRGYDSWGVAEIAKGKIFIKKRVGKIGSANVDNLPNGKIGLGHTRWATHGGVTEANAHPHLDCTENTVVVHNGIFENYEEIKKALIKKGHKFVSETDTETIAHMLEDQLKKLSLPEAVRKVFNQMEGLNAVITINTNNQSLVAARNGSPLVIGLSTQGNFLASDVSALLPFTKKIHFLEDYEMAILTDKSVNLLDVRTGKSKKLKIQTIDWNLDQGEKGKYKHYMLKEIYEQPGILSDIAVNGISQAEKIAGIIKDAKGSYLVGCGTASYACLAGTYLFSKIAKFHINSAVGSEFGYHLDFLNRKSLVIAISQSGETMDILESVKKAKEKGTKIASLVNVLALLFIE
jgi:glutamine---fructose-6-phosphate transaminase (isomerizing)